MLLVQIGTIHKEVNNEGHIKLDSGMNYLTNFMIATDLSSRNYNVFCGGINLC